jgi:hypothetical protein
VARWQTCGDCKGKGKIPCRWCLGVPGDEVCRECVDEGTEFCDPCMGEGGWYNE